MVALEHRKQSARGITHRSFTGDIHPATIVTALSLHFWAFRYDKVLCNM
ncbi:unnamed protein product, partial [Timema podura]|nr:unnamed protein product [Timema podura]